MDFSFLSKANSWNYKAYSWNNYIFFGQVRSTGNLAGVHAPAAGRMGQKQSQKVHCFPLLSFLLALNTTSLQYVSLDVEGAEADILINLPWEEVNVTVWSIEHRLGTNAFQNLYEHTPSPPVASISRVDNEKASSRLTHTSSPKVKIVTKVVYVGQQDPRQGKDPYFVRFMAERGYVLYDYWDGDYTFIKRNSTICERHCSPHLAT